MNRVWGGVPRLLGMVLLAVLAATAAPSPAAQSAHLQTDVQTDAQTQIQAHAQTSDPVASPKKPQLSGTSAARPASPDFSKEPIVIEQFFTTIEVQSDGALRKTVSARIRVQSDAGARQLSGLTFHYSAPGEQNDIHFVRARKPDGKIVSFTPGATLGVASPAVRDAPAFSGMKETHVALPSLSAGDILEYEIVTRTLPPLATGEFWFERRFLDRAIVLDEKLTMHLPLGRMINVKSEGFRYLTRSDPARHEVVDEWKHQNLRRPGPDDNAETDTAQNDPLQPNMRREPDVEISTFRNWPQVANWYSAIERDRTGETADIKAKVAELTRDRPGSLEKIEALYDYVSTKIRYVGVPFGEGSYPSHSAAEVFSHQYGDSNDKAALLAAMLHSAGIPAGTALISSSRKFDSGFPSPGQFDHVLTAVPLDKNLLWMDEAPEVAPFRLLAASLRDKPALLISPTSPGSIVNTPPDPPFTSTQDAEITGSVSDLGKLTAHIHYTLRGDTELVLRLAFHRAPRDEWRHLGETILHLDGIHGDVASVSPADPTDTKNPFQVDISFSQVNFLDWSSTNQRVALPLAALGLPDAPADSHAAIELGSPLTVATKISLVLPAAFSLQPPAATSISREYAGFESSYRFENHTLEAHRSLAFTVPRLAATRASDYKAFTRAVQADENQKFLAAKSSASVAVPSDAGVPELIEAGAAALNSENPRAALPLFQRVVSLEPRHQEAWDQLGLANLALGHLDEAAGAFRKQLEVNPRAQRSYYFLGLALRQQQKNDDAALAFRQQMEVNPLDKSALAALAAIYLDERDYAKALPVLDKATILSPDNAGLFISLGQAFAATGDSEQAIAALKRASALSPSTHTLNDVARVLASYKINLQEARAYSEAAVRQTGAQLNHLELSKLKNEDLREVAALGDYWDTLGWIDFQQGDLNSAALYLQASWDLNQRANTAGHLAQLYAKRGQKEAASGMFALALAVPQPDPDARARLTLLLGGNAGIDELVAKAQPQLEANRSIPVAKIPANRAANGASAEFLILLSPGKLTAAGRMTTKVNDVEFSGGDENLMGYTDRLRSLNYGMVFPGSATAKIVRRGTLACPAASSKSPASEATPATGASSTSAVSEPSPGCILILSLPEDVHLGN